MNRFAIAAGVSSAIVLSVSGAFGQAERSLSACQSAVAKESSKYIQVIAASIDGCMNRMSAEVLQGQDTAAAAAQAAKHCVSALRKLANSDDPGKQVSSQFDSKLRRKCDPAANPKLSHAESDTYTIGASTLGAANQNQFCQTFGGDGSIDSFAEWRDCLRAAAHCQALQTAATSWPRLLEYLAALRTAMAALPANTKTADALGALQSIESAVEGPTDDNVPELACGLQGASAHHSNLPGEVVTLAGPSLQTLASIPLPAGRHMLWARVQVVPLGPAGEGIECLLGDGGQSYAPATRDTVTFLGHITLSSAAVATLRCRALGSGEYSAAQQEVSAIAVDSIDVQTETCADGVLNQGEENVDCGGPCAACPNCSDGIRNQGEQGFDCGGPCAAVCPPATCDDTLLNQGETAVDCGGPCIACPTCSDGIRNQDESGIDCGGSCAECPAPTCSDGIRNQGEFGVDCGDPCLRCSGQPCGRTGFDCQSGHCIYGPRVIYGVCQ